MDHDIGFDPDDEDDDDGPLGYLSIGIAEFIQEEPLESRFRAAIAAAIARVPGVTQVFEADREVWGVHGDVDGEAVEQAVADVLTAMRDDLAPYADM